MSDFDAYPGLKPLERVETIVHALDSVTSPGDLGRLIDDLHAAATQGLPPERWVDATRVFFLAVQDALDRVDDLLALPDVLVTRILDAAHRDWLAQVPLLSPDDQANAWHLLDVLYANRVRSHQVESFIRDAESFLVGSPFPAVQTALQLALRLATMGSRDSRLPWTLDFLERNACDERTLVSVAALRHRLEIGFQEARGRSAGAATEGLVSLWMLNEAVSETFGGDMSVTTPESLDPRTRQQLAEAAGVLETRALEVSPHLDRRDPFCEGLLEYVMARIAASTGSLVEAIRLFERLSAKGFCLWDTGAYLARIWLERGYPDDARKAIEAVAERIPIVRGDPVGLFPLGELYLESGGDPSTLGLDEAPQPFVEAAQQNRDARQVQFHAALEEARDRALSDFWERRERLLLGYLARQVQGADFDAAVGGADAGRTIRLGREVAATTCLDRMPGIPQAVRSGLVAATRGPVPARDAMPHVLALLDDLERRGHPFEDLVHEFPGYGQSRAVAVARIRAEVVAGRMDGAVALLDLYEGLPGTSDEMLAALCEEALEPLGRTDRWLDTIRRGTRLWRRMRGEPGRRTGGICRELAFARLADEKARAFWVELATTVLDLMPDHDVQGRLWDWFKRRFETAPEDDVKLTLAVLLARRLAPPFQEWARGAMRETVARRLAGLASLDGPAARQGVLETLLDVGAGDPAIQSGVAAWFLRADALSADERAALGEWLHPRMTDEASARAIRQVARERLMHLLTLSARPELETGLIRRILALDPEDQALRTLLDDVRRSRIRFRWMIVGIAIGALTAIGALIIFLR
jgi:hypothetical protein